MLTRVARDFSDQVQWSQSTFGWIPSFRKAPKCIRLLGPLSLVRELDEKLWCTMSVLPISATQTEVRCDFHGEGVAVQKIALDKWRKAVASEIEAIQGSSADVALSSSPSFAYECGGKLVA
jgi:hypothetical protein